VAEAALSARLVRLGLLLGPVHDQRVRKHQCAVVVRSAHGVCV